MGQLQKGGTVQLPKNSTSWLQWSQRLTQEALRGALDGEQEYWRSIPLESTGIEPDSPEGDNRQESAETIWVELEEGETEALLRKASAASRSKADEILLTALARTLRKSSGSDSIILDLEGHGREESLMDLDVSRTIGWFTSMFPLHLEISGGDRASDLQAVKNRLRKVPQKGFGYGLLRYLRQGDSGFEPLRRGNSQIVFNYLGQFDQTVAQGSPFRPSWDSYGPLYASGGDRPHRLQVVGQVIEGRLRVRWTFSRSLYRRETMQMLADDFAQEVRSLIDSLQKSAASLSASDFELAGLTQVEFDRLARKASEWEGGLANIQDIYPLSPVQQGMLFHVLAEPAAKMYIEQAETLLRGEFRQETFDEAWRQAMALHDCLRTSIVWRDVSQPVQIVWDTLPLPIRYLDLSQLGESERTARIASLLDEDREAVSQLERAPLMRLTVVRGGPDEHRFLFSIHHLIHDGWSLGVLFDQVFSFCESGERGQALQGQQTRRYRDFIQHLAAGELPQGDFWKDMMAGFKQPTSLGRDDPEPRIPGDQAPFARQEIFLSGEESQKLESVSRQQRWTLNTLMLGAWALVLGHRSGERDITFGTTLLGRPHQLEGIQSTIGMFINTLPLRTVLEESATLGQWLPSLQRAQVEIQRREQTPLSQVQSYCRAAKGKSMFESTLILQNVFASADGLQGMRAGSFAIESIRTHGHNNYPLGIRIKPGPPVHVELLHDLRRFGLDASRRILRQFQMAIQSIIRDPQATIGDILGCLAESERRERSAALQQLRQAGPGLRLTERRPRSVSPLGS